MIERLTAAVLLSVLVSLAGWRAGALSWFGAITAAVVGSVVIASLSWPGALVLGGFFVSSSALSRLGRSDGIAQKGSRRDAKQVLANGGVAAIASLLALSGQYILAFAAFAGALSAATADTWATEVGSRSRVRPRFIVSRHHALPGQSGGVTPIGSTASLLGALLIAALSAFGATLYRNAEPVNALFLAVFLAGIIGSIIDSILGEMIQERRWCPICVTPTEAPIHRCGAATIRVGGLGWVDNDLVNVACTFTGGAVSGCIVLLWLAAS